MRIKALCATPLFGLLLAAAGAVGIVADEYAYHVTTLSAPGGTPTTRFRITGEENPARAIFENCNVGVGVTNPTEKLEVNGGVKIANSAGTADGTLRWTGSFFEARKGGIWVSLTGGDNLGNHTATQDLQMAGFDILDADVLEQNLVAAPSTPSSGKSRYFAKTGKGGRLFRKDSNGVEQPIGGLPDTRDKLWFFEDFQSNSVEGSPANNGGTHNKTVAGGTYTVASTNLLSWHTAGTADQGPWVASKNPIFIARCKSTANGTANKTLIGLWNSHSTPDSAIIFYRDFGASQNWKAMCSKDGTQSTLDLGVAADGTYRELMFVTNGTASVEFFIDGVSKGTISTANVPTERMSMGISCQTNGPTIETDFLYFEQDK